MLENVCFNTIIIVMKGDGVMKEKIEEAVVVLERSEVDQTKREFMKKFGKYAAVAPVGMYLLMGPGASKAQASAVYTTTPPPVNYYLADDQSITVTADDGSSYILNPGDPGYDFYLQNIKDYGTWD